MIAQVAYMTASSGFTDLVFFLGILSVNLAVLNFLPIPPLDGGQMVFLVAEKVRGRPLPESAVLAGTYFGLILVLCLMVFVTYQDVYRLVTVLISPRATATLPDRMNFFNRKSPIENRILSGGPPGPCIPRTGQSPDVKGRLMESLRIDRRGGRSSQRPLEWTAVTEINGALEGGASPSS